MNLSSIMDDASVSNNSENGEEKSRSSMNEFNLFNKGFVKCRDYDSEISPLKVSRKQLPLAINLEDIIEELVQRIEEIVDTDSRLLSNSRLNYLVRLIQMRTGEDVHNIDDNVENEELNYTSLANSMLSFSTLITANSEQKMSVSKYFWTPRYLGGGS